MIISMYASIKGYVLIYYYFSILCKIY